MITLITTARGPCWFSAVTYNGYRSMPNRLTLQLDGHYVHFKALFTVVIFNMGLMCVCVCVCVCMCVYVKILPQRVEKNDLSAFEDRGTKFLLNV